ncbi:MAG: S41 family peptidase, partial [Chitinophagaceae bacterium]
IRWEAAKHTCAPMADTCSSRSSFLHILESALNELYNGHCFLNTNTPSSNRLIPSGADLKVVYVSGLFLVDELRPGYNAAAAGIKKGMQIAAVNDVPISEAIRKFLPKGVTSPGNSMIEYAANMVLAGTHDKPRVITMETGLDRTNFYPDALPNKTEIAATGLLEARKLEGNTGYIRILNSLGNDELIRAFDEALDSLLNTTGMILDLRETPGGGTTTVARAIMGRFIDKEMPYQKHIYTDEEKETGIRRSTLELVSPRGKTYRHPLVVLVSYWTASMGEGMAIGFDAMKRAVIAGTPMAGLLGEISTFETPELKVPFSFPTVQLQTVSGKPREDFRPSVIINDPDQALPAALGLLKKKTP